MPDTNPTDSPLASGWFWLNVSWLFFGALELIGVLIRAATMQ